MQIVPFAKKGCKTCQGRGKYMVTRTDRNGNSQRLEEVCRCAIIRFARSNPNITEDPLTKVWYWPEDKATDAEVTK